MHCDGCGREVESVVATPLRTRVWRQCPACVLAVPTEKRLREWEETRAARPARPARQAAAGAAVLLLQEGAALAGPEISTTPAQDWLGALGLGAVIFLFCGGGRWLRDVMRRRYGKGKK